MKGSTLLFLLTCLLSVTISRAQDITASPEAQFSVITCGPGTELYATFGHSAFRFRDPTRGIDWVYNYGTFDFDTPNFYGKFVRGKLPYALAKQRFENFLYTYQLENRYVREQLLELSPAETNALLQFLEENNQPENRFYKYDFLFENCATKIPDILSKVLGPPLVYSFDHLTDSKSFRDLIHENLYWNSWSSFGIDLALGAVIDRKAEGSEFSFLPKYVEQQIANASLKDRSLGGRKRPILALNSPTPNAVFTATPLFWMLLVLGITLVITWIDFRNKTRSKVLDFILFFTTGAAGCLLLFLWFFTDHTATAWNGNLLWAFPLNLILAFGLLARPAGFKKERGYLILLLILLATGAGLWLAGVQIFSPVVLPLWAALMLRYIFLIHLKKMPI
ncbi:MAG: DUF4105 domain-containing protein [Robiginitalea sp.]|uniref:Lnb N-terminal periplasmic domain-containing protein n=1 Tax=Robiginitalea sp. TaxID=1902411 RepID=UPI003C790541